MASKSDVILKFKTDTGEVETTLQQIEDGLNAIEGKADDASGAVGSIEKSSKDGAKGFKVLDTALKASGIVFIVSKFIEFAATMAENKRVAEALEVVTAALGASINLLFEAVAPLGDALMRAFENPMEAITNIGNAIRDNIQMRIEGVLSFIPKMGKAWQLVMDGEWKAASKVAADATGQILFGVESVTDTITEAGAAVSSFAQSYVADVKEAVDQSNSLVKAQQKLRDEQRDLNVSYAEAKSQIEQLKLARDDQRKSIDERIAAAEEAAALDLEFAAQREDIANRNVALIQEEIRLQGDTIERQDRLAEARIAAAEATETSAGKQAELLVSIYGLEQERITQQQEAAAAEQELEVERQKNADAEKDRKKKQLADEKALNRSRIDLALQALSAIAALNTAFAKDDEEGAKRAFKRNKALALSTAVVNTGLAVVTALTGGGNLLKAATGRQFVEAGIAAAVGAAQIATIAKSKFDSSAFDQPSVDTGGRDTGVAGAAETGTPQLDLSFLGGGAGQTGIRAYIVQQDITTSAQAEQILNDQAALG